MQDDSKKVYVITGPPRERENTLSITLPDPKIDQFTFINSSLRIHTMKQFLSGFSIAEDHDQSGLDYPAFLRNIQERIKSLTLDAVRMDFIKTTTAIFLVSEKPDAMAIIKAALPDLNVGRKYVLSNGSETAHLCRFTGEEFEAIEASAKESVDLSALKKRLSKSIPVEQYASFDIQGFSEGINRASTFRDASDRAHYVIDHKDGQSYILYFGVNPKEHKENELLYVGKSEDVDCYLHHVEVV